MENNIVMVFILSTKYVYAIVYFLFIYFLQWKLFD